VREGQAAVLFEAALGSLRSGSWEPVETPDQDLLERLRVTERLVALDLTGESRVRESLRKQLAQALDERRARPGTQAPRRPWVTRRPLLAAELAVLATVVLLAVVAPRSLAALLEPVVRVIESVRVGDDTYVLRHGPQTVTEVAATAEHFRQQVASGQSWFLDTPYGGFGGPVPPESPTHVQRVSSLDRLRSLTPMRILVPTCQHRDEPVRFHHAFVAPGGWLLLFFGSGFLGSTPNELLLSQFPLGAGRSVSFGRSTGRRGPDGQIVVESPELKLEEMSFGGQTVVWDPDPEPPSPGPDTFSGTWSLFRNRTETSALHWEEDGVSYSLMGRSLTREEATDLFLSLRPLDEAP
jgi:hypothetical protein